MTATVDEAKTKAQKLEQQIAALLNHYTKETGATVTGVDVSAINAHYLSQPMHETMGYRVDVSVIIK